MIKTFDQLREETRIRISRKNIPKVGILFPKDNKFLQAAYMAHREGYIIPYLLGPIDKVKKEISDSDIDYGDYELVDCDSIESSIRTGMKMIQSGELNFLMKGFFGNKMFSEILTDPKLGYGCDGRFLSHVAIVESSRYHKQMFITDAGLNFEMNAQTMIGIVNNAASLARALGHEMPKAALLSAVEAIYPAVPVTMMEAAIAKMAERGQIKNVYVDGPLSLDVAINKEVAFTKGITESKVAGDADLFVCPSIETANGLYKAMLMYGLAESATVVVGGCCPLVSNFVVDCVDCIINSIVLGAYLSLDNNQH